VTGKIGKNQGSFSVSLTIL